MAKQFKFDAAFDDVPVPEDLTNGERAILRDMLEPGNPLWKIMRSMLDYREGLKQGLLGTDLTNQKDIEAARKVQATAVAIYWLEEMIAQSLVDVTEKKEEQAS